MVKAVSALLVLAALSGCFRRDEEFSSVQWPVMGTVASVRVRGSDCSAVRDVVMQVFSEVESLLNAHNPQSEIRHLAVLSNSEVINKCSPIVRPCYETAFEVARLSGYAFNPRWRGDKTLDLGAIAKGFAVDVASQKLVNGGLAAKYEILIDLGGNLKSVSGQWSVGVYGSSEVLNLQAPCSVATSGEYFRGAHIMDARTGKSPLRSPFSVTVVHPSSAMLADALSTVMFIYGPQEGERFLCEKFPEAKAKWVIK